MSNRIENDPEAFYFHVTRNTNVPEIDQSGLELRSRRDEPFNFENRVYLITSGGTFAVMNMTHEFIVWECSLRRELRMLDVVPYLEPTARQNYSVVLIPRANIAVAELNRDDLFPNFGSWIEQAVPRLDIAEILKYGKFRSRFDR